MVCNIPISPLVAEAPEYERPWSGRRPPYLSAADALEGIDQSPAEALSALMGRGSARGAGSGNSTTTW